MDKVGIGRKGHGRPRLESCRSIGRSMENLVRIAAIGAVIVLGLMLVFMLAKVITYFPQFRIGDRWGMAGWSPLLQLPRYGIVSLVLNSALLACGAIIIALPLGLATALYITEMAPQRVARVLWVITKGLAAMPSVIIGFIGIGILHTEKSTSVISDATLVSLTSLLLALMVYPNVVCFLIDTLRRIPASFKASSYALGASRWQTIAYMIYPAARPGIAAAGLFGFGRVLGDTVVVLMLAQVIIGGQLAGGSPLFTVPTFIAVGAESAVLRNGPYHTLYLLGSLVTAVSYSLSHYGRRLVRTQRGEIE